MKEQKIIYYHDELNDDFANNNINGSETPDDYNYINHNFIYNFFSFVIYRLIVTPMVFLYVKVKYNQVFKNKKVISQYMKKSHKGYFLYFNHTNGDSDAFIPSLVSFHKVKSIGFFFLSLVSILAPLIKFSTVCPLKTPYSLILLTSK